MSRFVDEPEAAGEDTEMEPDEDTSMGFIGSLVALAAVTAESRGVDSGGSCPRSTPHLA